jgi:type I restriction enzyme R subunit
VEAKAAYRHPADGLQQTKDYATILGLTFAYATNGTTIIEFDFTTGNESQLTDFVKSFPRRDSTLTFSP